MYLTIFSSADLVIAVMGDKLPLEASFKVNINNNNNNLIHYYINVHMANY